MTALHIDLSLADAERGAGRAAAIAAASAVARPLGLLISDIINPPPESEALGRAIALWHEVEAEAAARVVPVIEIAGDARRAVGAGGSEALAARLAARLARACGCVWIPDLPGWDGDLMIAATAAAAERAGVRVLVEAQA